MKNQELFNFKSSALGIDPITQGKFTMDWAVPTVNEEEDDNRCRAIGNMRINAGWPEENPLYKIAKDSPLRLQGLLASVDFGVEKRFIRIMAIKAFERREDYFSLGHVEFEILDNIDYLEGVQDYRDNNLL